MKHFVEVVSLKQWITFSLVVSGLWAFAQNIPVGTWRTHFSYQQALLLEQAESKVFCATTNGLFSFDLSDGSVRRLSKIDGLSDVGISALKYEPSMNILVIGYRSGLVDLVFEDRIESITDIFNSNLSGNKQINDIAMSQSEAFLATNLGVVVIDIENVRIRENYVQIGAGGLEVEVSEMELLDNTLYINTSAGLQSGRLSDNLLDFNNWVRFDATENFSSLIVSGSDAFSLDGINVFQLVNNDWQDIDFDLPGGSKLFPVQGNVYSVSPSAIFQLGTSGFEEVQQIAATTVNDLLIVDGIFWFADDSLGLIDQNERVLSPPGPVSDVFSRLKVWNEELYGFHAPNANGYDGSQKTDGYSLFSSETWSIERIPAFQNITDVGVFGTNRYFGSVGDGLYDELSGEVLNDIPNSSAELDTMITAIKTTESMWVSSYGTFQPVARLNEDGWQAFASQTGLNNFTEVEVSRTGVLWLSEPSEGIVTFDPEEIRSQLINSANGLSGVVNDIEISIEDDIWVATSEGPVTFSDASFIFDFNEGFSPSFENEPLFEGEPIKAIQTDGGNRVWFATSRGLWLFDENITEQIFQFTTENSPIPSDEVLDLAYNGTNGELFILTDKGLVSFRSASSIGTRSHSNVNIFPNPVTPAFQGLVGISGLANNAVLKVTDLNGVLVKEVEANGGAASWDLRNTQNSRVNTGVYLVFSATEDGEETFVGKIAVIR